MFGKTVIYAHRGASGTTPENTMAAFSKAATLGAHGIECDVQMTRDGKLVICHDEEVDRTSNGKGFIKDMSYEDIRALDMGSWFGAEYAGERMPLLEELLDLIKKQRMYLNIELKNGVFLYEGMEDKVVDMVKSFDLQDQTIFSSFNHYSIYDLKKKHPGLFTGALYMEGLFQPWKYLKELSCDCAHPFYMAARPEINEGCRQHDITVNVFTVDDPHTAALLVKSGVEGIITNYPERMKTLPDMEEL
jgi:glycerophosphoryl diester phosphodiesterase